jgi:hypothetical protein
MERDIRIMAEERWVRSCVVDGLFEKVEGDTVPTPYRAHQGDTMGPNRGQADKVVRESFPDDLDQSPEFDPTEPEPVPEDDFDQSWRT